MMTWDCTHCGMVRHAPCAGATCLPAQRIDEREFRSAQQVSDVAPLGGAA